MCPSVCLGHSGTPCGGGWSSIGKGTLSVASQRRVDFEIICTERVGFSLIRASEQFDELSLSLSRFLNGREQGGHRQVQGLVRPSCCPNAHPSVPCRVATSRVLCIFRCTPAGVAAKSTSLATTEHRARRVGAKGLAIIGTSIPVSIRQIHDSCVPRRETIERPVILFGAMVELLPDTGPVKDPPIWQESSSWNAPRICTG